MKISEPFPNGHNTALLEKIVKFKATGAIDATLKNQECTWNVGLDQPAILEIRELLLEEVRKQIKEDNEKYG